MMRRPVSFLLAPLRPRLPEVVYARKGGHDEPEQTEGERIDAMDSLGQHRCNPRVPSVYSHRGRRTSPQRDAARTLDP